MRIISTCCEPQTKSGLALIPKVGSVWPAGPVNQCAGRVESYQKLRVVGLGARLRGRCCADLQKVPL